MAGILDWITESAKKQYQKGAPYREAVTGLLQGDTSGFNKLNSPTPVNPNEAVDVAMSFAPLGITAWHGTPYQFNKFDTSKIGSGEGAQAYGHGLYFAENPNVAMSYKDKLSSGVTINDKFIDDAMINTAKDKITANVLQKLKNAGEVSNSPFSDVIQSASKEELAVLKQLKPNLKTGSQTGSLYKVDIADETLPRMLDWDKPISEQSKEVQKAISPIVKTYGLPSSEKGSSVYQATKEIFGQEKKLMQQRDALFSKYQKEGMSLSDAVRAMTPEDRASFSSIAEKIGNINKAQEMASNYLQKRGLTGIKYLDEGSRINYQGQTTYKGQPYGDIVGFPTKKQLDDYILEKSKEGFGVNIIPQTSNFVVFDPNTVKILERNGLLLP